LLDVSSLYEREVLLDLLQRPARADQVQQALHREPVPAYTRLAANLARLNRDPINDFQPQSCWLSGRPARRIAPSGRARATFRRGTASS
jgi:hypothetical protein